MHFYQKLGYYDSAVDIFLGMDVKSVQYETMGFWFLKPVLANHLEYSNDLNLVKMLRAYQENSRECAEVCLIEYVVCFESVR